MYQEKFGFIFNTVGVMAESPAALKGYAQTYGLLGETAFTPAEQQLIFLSVSRENACTYCVAAHSMAGQMMGLDNDTIAAVRDGKTIMDPKLAAISSFATDVVKTRGNVSKDALHDFMVAGHTKTQVLDILLAVATKTISNYMNHITDTPLDEVLVPFAWEPST
jgi:uncharacterized peroxidase-related enzyme